MSASRRLAALTVAVSAALLVPQPALGRPRSFGQAGEAVEYLDRIASARRATYQARQLVVYLEEPQSAVVVDVHMTERGRFVRVESPTDTTRMWLDPRHGLVSGGDGALEEARPPTVPFDRRRILDKYDVEVEPAVAMLAVTVVPLALVRREDRRLVERMWVHPESGVVYRRELYGKGSGVAGLMTTLDMRWGESADPEPYRGKTPEQVRAAPSRGAPSMLPFGYELVASSQMSADGRPVTHWLYSDGLHALSVFKLRGGMQHPKDYRKVDLRSTTGYAGPGPGTWMWEGGDATWAMVSEEMQLDPARMTAGFPQGDRSLRSRGGSWWSKAFRWVRDRF